MWLNAHYMIKLINFYQQTKLVLEFKHTYRKKNVFLLDKLVGKNSLKCSTIVFFFSLSLVFFFSFYIDVSKWPGSYLILLTSFLNWIIRRKVFPHGFEEGNIHMIHEYYLILI